MLPKNDCIRKLFVVFSFFETLCTRVGNSERFGQGFVHSDSDVRYFGEDVPGVSQSFSEDQTFSYQDEQGTITVLGSPIKFDPPNLNFKEQPIGVPNLKKVTIHNINGHSSIQMLSISGNTIHFHCSFFNDKVIPPGGNTTFDVVFLGREAGRVENTLYIHTSAGSFRYNVEGSGTPNPYRIRPLTGVRLPLNSSYSPVIEMHNPHSATIQVLEMYSSGGDLHLELPSGGADAETDLWQIPPYHTKQVMRANFLARAESNHTAYIRIKTNTTGAEFLYLPLEVEVTSQPGLYCPQERLDFGLVPSDSGPRTLTLNLLNSGARAVTVASLVTTPVTDAIGLQFSPVKVQPDTLRPTAVAVVTFNPKLVAGDGVQSGKLLIKSDNSKFKVVVPWTATVLKGGLAWDQTAGRFLLSDSPDPENPSHAGVITTTRPLVITNKFAVPVVVYSVKLAPEAEKVFEVTEDFQPTVIKAGESVNLVTLSVRREAWVGERQCDSYLTLKTNLTSVKVPLVTFDGNLTPFFPSSPSESVLDFGTIGMNEKRDMYFALINKGPVKVVLRGWGGNITGSLIELMGVGPGNETELLSPNHNHTDLARRLYVMPGHYVVYRIGLLSGAEEGQFQASVFVSTEYQELKVPFRFRVAKGSLSTLPTQLTFDTAFPGKVSELRLHVHSSFKHRMLVKSLSVVGGDPRFTFKVADPDEDPGAAVILPGQKSEVGRVIFDPGSVCREVEDCYTGFPPEGNLGHPWYLGLALPLNLGKIDLDIVDKLWARMRAAAYPTSMFNVTLRLDTTEVRGFLFSARAALSWPVLASQANLQFPLTQLGNSSRMELLVTNPSSQPLLVHLVPVSAYPNAQHVLKKLPNRIKLSVAEDEFVEQNDSDSLFVIESVTDADDPFNPLDVFGEGFSEKFGIDISTSTFPVLLRPGQTAKVGLAFTPNEPVGMRSSVLFIRNNLTGVEVVDLGGSGATGDIKFGNRKAGSIIHAFEVTEKHLKDCDKSVSGKQSHSLPNLTVKRPFTARNTGQVPLWVTGFDVDGKPCEGFGFKVLDCEPFLLAANDSKKINIAFTPDFTLSRVTRTLTLKTSLGGSPGQGNVKYSLAATVPSHLLSICSRALPRPGWEVLLYYGVLSLLTFSLGCVIIAAFVEADRILKFCFLLASPSQHNFVPENAKLLDLKEVARSVVLESDKKPPCPVEGGKTTVRASSSSRLPVLPSTGSVVQEFRRVDTLDSLVREAEARAVDQNSNTHTSNSTARSLLDPKAGLRKLKIAFWIVIDFFVPYQAFDKILKEDSSTPENSEQGASKKIVVEPRKKADPVVSTVTSRKTKNRKIPVKPKLSSQNSINDELETSSTTTESSNPEDVAEPFTKGIQILNHVGSDSSSSPSMPEQSKKKKKTGKGKVDASENANRDVKCGAATKPAKKTAEKPVDLKQDPQKQQEKVKVTPKASLDSQKASHNLQSATPPPSIKPNKQEAKVKGVPKEGQELRRQQSAPAYDRPPRLQAHGNPLPVRHSAPEGGYSAGQHNTPGQPLDGFPTVTVVQKPDPPRAIILPEVKQNPGSQFGPIGSRGGGGGGGGQTGPPAHKSTWQDSPAAPSPGQGRHHQQPVHSPQGGLLPPPGLTIMQQLQAERRQREEEYVRRQNNWPGFGDRGGEVVVGSGHLGIQPNNYVESLWDSQPGGRGGGQAAAASPPVTSVGSGGGSSQPGLWGTIGNVWPSSVFNTGFNYNEGNEGGGAGGEKDGETLAAYDSLSLSSIWSSGAGGGAQAGEVDNGSWSSLFNNSSKKEL